MRLGVFTLSQLPTNLSPDRIADRTTCLWDSAHASQAMGELSKDERTNDAVIPVPFGGSLVSQEAMPC